MSHNDQHSNAYQFWDVNSFDGNDHFNNTNEQGIQFAREISQSTSTLTYLEACLPQSSSSISQTVHHDYGSDELPVQGDYDSNELPVHSDYASNELPVHTSVNENKDTDDNGIFLGWTDDSLLAVENHLDTDSIKNSLKTRYGNNFLCHNDQPSLENSTTTPQQQTQVSPPHSCNKALLTQQVLHEIRELQHELYRHYYLLNINLHKLKYFDETIHVTTEYSKLHQPKRSSYISLFVDARGQGPPTIPEGIIKAEAKQQLPIFRKKYDWNLRVWNNQDRRHLWTLVAQRMETDIVKLMTDRKLYIGEIESKHIFQTLAATKKSLGYNKNIEDVESMKKRIDVLRQELLLKEERLTHQQQENQCELVPSSSSSSLLEQPLVSSNEVSLASTSVVVPVPPKNTTTIASIHRLQVGVNESITASKDFVKTYWIRFWDSIAKMIGSRFEWSGRDCSIQWMHHQSPEVNVAVFSKEEDTNLLQLISAEKGNCNWDMVAKALRTGRTAYQCFERYQRVLNKCVVRGEWTPEEDQELIAAVEDIGDELTGPSRWSRIAARLPGRPNSQCRSRYLHTLQANIKHGGWTLREDLLLQTLVETYGRKCWAKVARHMPWRTDMKCRERYENVLLTSPCRLPQWSNQERIQLKNIILQHYNDVNDIDWECVASLLPQHIEFYKRKSMECQEEWNLINQNEKKNIEDNNQKNDTINSLKTVKSHRGKQKKKIKLDTNRTQFESIPLELPTPCVLVEDRDHNTSPISSSIVMLNHQTINSNDVLQDNKKTATSINATLQQSHRKRRRTRK